VDGEIIGTLDVHSKRDRQAFNDQDLQILSLMASQAAVAIETASLLKTTREQALDNADLAARDANKLRRLEQLTIAYSEIMSNLAEMGLDERLNLIAKHATEILEAETCAIFLVKRSGFLSLEASYGHREGHFIKGREFAIRTGFKTGLNGHIAHEGKLFNSHGDALFNHIAARRMPYHGSADDQYSVLAIPLKQVKDGREKLIGMLRVDNKRDASGQPGLQVKFGQEDEWILSLFADAVTVAIEGAELVDQFREQKDHWARLVASSPNAIIAIDVDGKIESINAEAQKILRYRPDEVFGESVKEIYSDVKDARRVSKLLYEASDGRLFNHETFVNTKDGERIPIRLAATQLINAQGDRIGSVGYFEDLRSIKVAERRLELLLKASNTVAQAENLTEALQSLAQMLTTFLDISFCRNFLLSEDQQFLVPYAAFALYPKKIAKNHLDWNVDRDEGRIVVKEWPQLENLLTERSYKVFRADHIQDAAFLSERSRQLGLKQSVQSLLLIPLQAGNRVVGLLALGEMRTWDTAPFTEQKQELAIAIADQTAMMIERVRLLDTTTRHNKLLVALDEASRHIRAENEEFKLLQGVVRLAAEIVSCESGGIYTYRPHLSALELEIVYELPETLMGNRIQESEGIGGLVAQTGTSQKIEDYHDWSKREPFFAPYQFKTVVGVPLISQTGDVEAILFVADSTDSGRFTQTDIDILERFAVQASIALRTSKLMSREQRMTGRLDVLYKISDYIQTTTKL
ncbi:MAG: GAF domain-containing protein, partial [Anaerolineae bacterium]|nr:GAF domain-containing protein [Anaerolineae bacterium]